MSDPTQLTHKLCIGSLVVCLDCFLFLYVSCKTLQSVIFIEFNIKKINIKTTRTVFNYALISRKIAILARL